jgi:hypothetical protein
MCQNRKGGKKSANIAVSEAGGTSGYGNLLPTILLVCQSLECGLSFKVLSH